MLSELDLARGYREKKRELVFMKPSTGIEWNQDLQSGAIRQAGVYNCSIVGAQETVSRENREWGLRNYLVEYYKRRGQAPPSNIQRLDIGGSFYSKKNEYYGTHPWVKIPRSLALGSYRWYDGPLFAKTHVVGPKSAEWPTLPASFSLALAGKGATAIAQTIPTNPVANSAQIIGELRESVPKLPGWALIGSKANVAKRFADEYLNLEFGVKPMMSDLRQISDAVKRSTKLLKQLERDSGRLIRRSYDFPIDTSTQRTLISPSTWTAPALNTWLYLHSGYTLYQERTVTQRFWFRGAYTYYYEMGEKLTDSLRRAEQSISRLFGTRVTPELLWELEPWSWAIDWVTNIGDVIHNITAFSHDSLVMPYAYIMGNYIATDKYTLHGVQFVGLPPQTLVQSFTTNVKFRSAATPYGFGLDPAAFSPRQWAILGALGITRATR